MSTLHNNLTQAIDLIIEARFETYEQSIDEKIALLEQQIQINAANPIKEILQQKEVFELLGIGRRRLKKWVDRGLNETRIGNRVYYRYSELMQFMEDHD